MSNEVIFLAGRYNKYLRNLSQSPWIDKDDRRIKNSVQELIEDGLKKYLDFEKCVFSSSGREDVDVRMLGRGRPFVFRLINVIGQCPPSQKVISEIQNYLNTNHGEKISIRDLQVVSKDAVSKNLKDGEEEKTKTYRAICCCSRELSDSELAKISSLKDLTINQKTPIRVLHRRSLTVRRRVLHNLTLAHVNWPESDRFKPSDLSRIYQLDLITEAGTYIKEFVHSDFGRTEPSLSSLIGNCEFDLIELDVLVSNNIRSNEYPLASINLQPSPHDHLIEIIGSKSRLATSIEYYRRVESK